VLARHGIDITRDKLDVGPAAHTLLGGAKVDERRETRVPGLYAAGEAAGGIHGAGRLAGGSGTDVIVAGYVAGAAAAEHLPALPSWERVEEQAWERFSPDSGVPDVAGWAREQIESLRRAVATASPVFRDDAGLAEGLERVRALQQQLAERSAERADPADPRLRLEQMLEMARLVLGAALERTESRGAHQRTDYPHTIHTGSATSSGGGMGWRNLSGHG